MGKNQDWLAVEKVVSEGLADGFRVDDPPTTAEDLMWLAATITDQVVAAFTTIPRRS